MHLHGNPGSSHELSRLNTCWKWKILYKHSCGKMLMRNQVHDNWYSDQWQVKEMPRHYTEFFLCSKYRKYVILFLYSSLLYLTQLHLVFLTNHHQVFFFNCNSYVCPNKKKIIQCFKLMYALWNIISQQQNETNTIFVVYNPEVIGKA